MGPFSEPEPDVSVVSGSRDDYDDHPSSAILVVEVAHSSIQNDRERKGSLYARAGIEEYWIVNLVVQQLEVCRDPVPDAVQPYGFRYRSVAVFTAHDQVDLLAFPDVTVRVNDLLA